MDVLLVHGYNVTSTKTYGVLPERLKTAGYNIRDVFLSKYVTLDDDITIADIVRAFQAALLDIYGAGLGTTEFSCITHSTGALVVRSWIQTYYLDAMGKLPLKHLIMLAPPTNGSRLAELGKSRLSRLRSLVGIEPGLKVLDALELGSMFQWQLNSTWMTKKLHAASNFYPVVIAGQWIDKQLWDVIVPATYERGSDGVVRAAAANLNMQKITIQSDGQPFKEVMGGVPFLMTPKTSHSDTRYGIMASIPEQGDHPVLSAILSVLTVNDRTAYDSLEADFAMKTAQLQRQDTYYDGSPLDRYCQIVFRITDNVGNILDDYAIELIDSAFQGQELPSGFFADRHKNENNPEMFVYFLDYDKISAVRDGRLGFKVQSVPNTPLITYAESTYISPSTVESMIQPNQTTFVDVIMRRRINKETFRLTKDFSIQDITGKPGPDWIE